MSIPFAAHEVLEWTGGEWVQGSSDARFAGASIDTRTLTRGELFLAIVGPRHDAHRFLPQALAGGAAGLVIERGRALPGDVEGKLPVIAVDDTTRALGALASGHRAAYAGPLIAITGSNGKTTTKEMCAAILSVAAPCLKNAGNLNNEYGLPLTLLRRCPSHRSVVVELGMNHRGEIAALAEISRPTVGVITNAGSAHIEHLGSREEIAREKGDLVAQLPAAGAAVLNADDRRVAAQATRTRARVVRFGRAEDADVRATGARLRNGAVAFDLVTDEGRVAVEAAGFGEMTLANALAAAAAALAAGASLEQVTEGLRRYRPMGGRMERIELAGGVVVINDSYNANPESTEVALRALAHFKEEGRTVAVLGDMGELGPCAEGAHREIGRLAGQLGIDFLFALGAHAERVAGGAMEAGATSERVRVAGSHEEASAELKALLRAGDRVLVKGSRAMHMERVVDALASGGAR